MALIGSRGTVISMSDSRWPDRRWAKPDREDQWEQQKVRVSDAPDLESGPCQVLRELRAAVASDLSAEHGVIAGENFQRRNVDQDLSSGPQHPIHLIERLSLDLVLERIQHVERGDQVELAAGKGQARGGRAGDTALAAIARVREAAPGDVDAPGPSELPEHLQVMAGAASAVEDPRRLDAFGRLAEQRLDETAESVEPEVVAFGPCRCFEQAIHR